MPAPNIPTPAKKPKARGRPRGPRSGFGEVGMSGLTQSAGIVSEEWLPQMKGTTGVRSIKTMLGTDATVSAVMTAAKMAVRQVPMFVEPGGDSTGDHDCADHVSRCIFEYMDQTWAENLTEILTCMEYGWAWKEKVYEKHVETGTIIWKKWAFRPQETLDRWEFDTKVGEFVGMNQVVTSPVYKRVLIPKEKSLHFTLNATKGNPEGVSLLRGAYMAWYAKHKLELIELIGIERNLAGLPDIKIPAKNFETKNTPVLQKYMEIARKVHRNEDTYILTPSDVYPGTQTPMYSVGLVGGQQLTTRGTGLPTIQPIERYQAEIARCLLADFMLLPAGGPGSYALSSNKSSFFVMFIESICDSITDIINKQAIPELCDMNAFNITTYPKLVHGNVARTAIADLGRLLANLYKAGADMFPNDELLNATLDEAGLPHITSPEPLPVPEQLKPFAGQQPEQPEQLPGAGPGPNPDRDRSHSTAQKQALKEQNKQKKQQAAGRGSVKLPAKGKQKPAGGGV